MAVSDPVALMAFGVSWIASTRLINQIDYSAPDTKTLMAAGYSAAQANALALGIADGFILATDLIAVGFHPFCAVKIASLEVSDGSPNYVITFTHTDGLEYILTFNSTDTVEYILTGHS